MKSISSAHPRRTRRRLSDVLTELANDPDREEISFADIRHAMGDRAFGALMFVFAAPNSLPVNAPGVSAILGMPVLFLAVQLMLGWREPWLPAFITRRRVTRQRFAQVMNHIVPWIRKAERLLKPRLIWLTDGLAERLIGLLCALVALALILPIPFGNVPTAIIICILSLALLENDGLAALVGFAATAAATALGSGLLVGLVKGVSLFLQHLFNS